MTAKSVSQVLSEAADLLEKPGAWGQESEVGKNCHCIGTAIEHVLGEADYDGTAFGMLYQVGSFRNIGDIIDWNDAAGRTQEEAVSMLRRAAALAKEQGR